jgi:hypothetical protein
VYGLTWHPRPCSRGYLSNKKHKKEDCESEGNFQSDEHPSKAYHFEG